MRFSEITFNKIKNETEYFLKKTYNKAGTIFGPATAYGQIMQIVQEYYQLVMLYVKNAGSQIDVFNSNARGRKQIRFVALTGGHNPGRDISATGVLKFKTKSSISVEEEIPGSQITIFDKTLIKNNTNGLNYIIDLGTDKITYRVTNGFQCFLNIIQGKWEKQTFTGTGEQNQSFSVNVPGIVEIENSNIKVSINGQNLSLKKNVLDMLPGELACVVKTGFTGGVDLIFGNDGFGTVPAIGAVIDISYILTDGERGNIFRNTINDFKFIDDIFDGLGGTVNIDDIFDIYIEKNINFGAAGESVEFMKNILPIVSNNFVLGLPQQYAYHIKRFGIFSRVTSYNNSSVNNDEDTTFVYAVPDVRLFKEGTTDYFNLAIDAFYLDQYEKDKILLNLKSEGKMALTKSLKIVDPVLKKYVMNVFVRIYDDAVEDAVKSEIVSRSSEFFLNNIRTDRIPASDVITNLKNITGIDSVEVVFISEENENYHLRANLFNNNVAVKNVNATKFKPLNSYIPDTVLGLEPALGDIIFKEDELPIIRGGWTDRNGLKYNDIPTQNGLGPINIFVRGITPKKSILI
jgi:hypothetical protein